MLGINELLMNVLIPDQSSVVQKMIENYQILNRQDQDHRYFCKNFNLGIYFLIKAIECLVNRLLRYQILGFIFSIFINLDASMLVSPKEVFRNLMCWDMMESSKRRNFTYTFMGRNFKKGSWTGWSYRSSFHRRSWL